MTDREQRGERPGAADGWVRGRQPGLVETALRVAVLGLAALSLVGRRGEVPAASWWIYGIGLLLYVGSYLAQVFLPQSGWSRSAVGFAAPAWTTAFWLLGIGLVTRPWPALPWMRLAYLPADRWQR